MVRFPARLTVSSVALIATVVIAGCGSQRSSASDEGGSTTQANETAAESSGEAPMPSPGVHTLEVEGTEIVYEIAGEGEPAAVLLHGGQSNREVWRALSEELSEQRRVVMVDLPGHGESGTPSPLDAEAFSGAVEAVLDDARVGEAVLVGHSFGVWIARDVAIARPEAVVGLVMVDGYVVPLGGDPALGQALLMQFESEGWEAVAEGFVEQFMLGADTPMSVADFVRAMMLAGPQALWVDVLTIASDPAIERETVVPRPTLAMFVPGLGLPADYQGYLAARFEPLDFRLEPPGAGHFVMLERPRSFASDVSTFIENLEPGL
ncbi:MAG: alpha/beta hydrolase [Deltaproteobacteria bacterium]|nr:alpha/beta hydrolase [Deltaproteobacteria bacterium]